MSSLRSLPINIQDLLSNEYISTGVILLLVLYGGIAAPNLPNSIGMLFSNPLFNLAVIFTIGFVYKQNKSIALIASIAYIMSLQTLNKLRTSEVIANEIINTDPILTQLVGEEIKKLVAEEMKRPAEERRPSEEIRQVAEERVERHIMEESRKPIEEVRPSEEHRIFSEVLEVSEARRLVGEEMRKLVAEEMRKPAEERRPSEEIRQVAEERVQIQIMEESTNQVLVNEEQNNMPLNRDIDELVRKDVTPISRVLVEEELKNQPVKVQQVQQIPLPVENTSFANINDNETSLLQNQIEESKLVDTSTRSSRGIQINNKCNLCNNKPKAEQNNSIEIGAYGGNTFAEF